MLITCFTVALLGISALSWCGGSKICQLSRPHITMNRRGSQDVQKGSVPSGTGTTQRPSQITGDTHERLSNACKTKENESHTIKVESTDE